MKIEIVEKITIATPENETTEQVVSSILAFAESGITTHLILNLLAVEDVNVKELKSFKPVATLYKKAKKSLIVVCKDIDFTAAPAYLNVVPTIMEANDIIDMEDIERDLGF